MSESLSISSKEGRSIEEPKWVSQAKLFLEESRIDLECSRLLVRQRSEGVNRRRLFFLQQSLEKSTKGIVIVLGFSLMDLPKILVLGHYLRGSDKRKHKATLSLEARVRKIVQPLMTAEKPDFKSLRHDPATKLQILSLLEGLCQYSSIMELPPSITEDIKSAIDMWKKSDVVGLMQSIDNIQQDRERLSEKAKELDPKHNLRELSRERQLRYVEDAAIPNLIADVLQISLYLCLGSYLAKYEQASRYPDEIISRDILDNLDKLTPYVEHMIQYTSELFIDRTGVTTLDNFRKNRFRQ